MSEHELVAWFRQPDAYPWSPASVDVIETHISWVFLAGDRVLKLKRPVDYGFVDYTSLEKRRVACLDEVRLNRRLSDGVYIDALPITRDQHRYQLGGAGEPVEWATLMRRLPADRMLDRLLARQSPPSHLGERLARRLVPFHLREAAPCIGEAGTLSRNVIAVVTDNLDELEPFRGEPLDGEQLGLIARAMRRFIATHQSLLVSRVTDGWVREGHGDLRCEHICLEPDGTVQIYDCVEFNRDLRCADIASDLAFLLMDLYRLDAPGATADALLQAYRSAGVDLPDALLRFYWVHRALVRAKVACLEWVRAPADDQRVLAPEAIDHLHVAAAQALTVRPALIAMTGLSGSGKSTVARALARALQAHPLASDAIRKENAGTDGPTADAWQHGIYAPERTTATYQRLLQRGETAIREGRIAILDAAFLDGTWRERAADVARQRGVPFVLVETVCDENIVARRLIERQQEGTSISDATLETYRRQRSALEHSPPTVPTGTVEITIDTTRDGPIWLGPALVTLEHAGVLAPIIDDTRELLAGAPSPHGKIPDRRPLHREGDEQEEPVPAPQR